MNTLLFQRFQFKKPIEIIDLPEGSSDETIVMKDKIIIKGSSTSLEKDLAEMLSRAKLGEDDPLLVTFVFQQDITPQEEKYASMFFRLCQPLQDAWTYRTMRKYMPDAYEKEMSELFDMWQKLSNLTLKNTNAEMRRQILGMWAVLFENPTNDINLIMQSDEENKASWDAYIGALEEYIRQEPNVNSFPLLPRVVNAPYTVSIENDNGYQYYYITGGEKYDYMPDM